MDAALPGGWRGRFFASIRLMTAPRSDVDRSDDEELPVIAAGH
jgi:hypothetical protein